MHSSEKYGFVYIWRDRKNNRYYIGSHWGHSEDGYICSSDWMRHSYKRRPFDFKRKIIAKVYTNRADLLTEEQKWLNLIKDEELSKRYFNHNKNILYNAWWMDPERAKTVGERISKSLMGHCSPNKGKKCIWVIERNKQRKGLPPWNKGIKIGPNPDHSKKIKGWHPSLEQRQKMSKSKLGNNIRFGKKHSEETKIKMSLSRMNNQNARKK